MKHPCGQVVFSPNYARTLQYVWPIWIRSSSSSVFQSLCLCCSSVFLSHLLLQLNSKLLNLQENKSLFIYSLFLQVKNCWHWQKAGPCWAFSPKDGKSILLYGICTCRKREVTVASQDDRDSFCIFFFHTYFCDSISQYLIPTRDTFSEIFFRLSRLDGGRRTSFAKVRAIKALFQISFPGLFDSAKIESKSFYIILSWINQVQYTYTCIKISISLQFFWISLIVSFSS